jgi:hypothetical protein
LAVLPVCAGVVVVYALLLMDFALPRQRWLDVVGRGALYATLTTAVVAPLTAGVWWNRGPRSKRWTAVAIVLGGIFSNVVLLGGGWVGFVVLVIALGGWD